VELDWDLILLTLKFVFVLVLIAAFLFRNGWAIKEVLGYLRNPAVLTP
jgi:hypothetical protein